MKTRASFSLLCIALALAGCFKKSPPPGTEGELGNGSFTYECSGPSDSFCDDGGQDLKVPKAVALGSAFIVTYTPIDEEGPVIVEPASLEQLDVVDSFSSTFKALSPGFGGLIARRGETLLDVVHLRIEMPDHMRVDQIQSFQTLKSGVTSIELSESDSVQLEALVFDAGEDVLAGALPGGWTSDDEKIASMSFPADNRIFVNGNGAGETVLHLKLGELSADVTVTVLPGASSGSGGAGGGSGGAGGAVGAGGAGGGGGN